MTKKYIQVGKEGKGVFDGEYTGSGIIFKSEENYLNRPDAICYIPEYGFPEDSDFRGTIDTVEGYTQRELMELCKGNQKLCDCLFYELSWQFTETLLNEIDEEEFK
ncbi:MAG: thrombopoietin receptor [Tannerellaceae bacterium]|jgi:hypothetical protein|nr:thrombopoietin receptor [Tannerellaceae bacterium]